MNKKNSRGGKKSSFDKKYPSNPSDRRNPQKKFYKKKSAPIREDDGTVRLNKFLADAGICSRREADELIKTGLVEINGKINSTLGYRVQPDDIVKFDGRTIRGEKNVYVLLNKPKGFITSKDLTTKKNVSELVRGASPYNLYPIVKMDRPSTGVLLMTNDRPLLQKLEKSAHRIQKIYQVSLNKPLHGDHLIKIKNGELRVYDEIVSVDNISFIEGKPHTEVGISFHEGMHKLERKMFEILGYEVLKSDLVSFSGLTKKNLKRGQWRVLAAKEIDFLRMR